MTMFELTVKKKEKYGKLDRINDNRDNDGEMRKIAVISIHFNDRCKPLPQLASVLYNTASHIPTWTPGASFYKEASLMLG